MHTFPITVYYEDTDMAGIVYYANYLRYIERARSLWVEELGVDQLAMKAQGVVFAVRRVVADYLMPAQFADRLVVETRLTRLTAARMEVTQVVRRGEDVLFTADVVIVCIGPGGAPTRLPAELRRALQ